MKTVMKAVPILMAILTVTYVGVGVYANTTASSNRYVLYAAFEYEGETPPTEWYTPEQLGIYGVIEYGENSSYWLHIAVDREKEPFPLQEKQPIFLYKDKYYQVSPLWATPGLPESVKQWQIPIGGILGAGWAFTGILFLKWRRKE
jgi:hypothetical protein